MQCTNDLLQLKLKPEPSWRKIQQRISIDPCESHVAVLVQGRFMLVYGGLSAKEVLLNQYWLLDLQTISWRKVSEVSGHLQAKVGLTFTPVGEHIYAFGGDWGTEENTHYSNDISRLTFQGEISPIEVPSLLVNRLDTSGTKPQGRSGHCCVDYKGKILIVIGGEGHSAKRTSILFNDVWTFDLRKLSWSELPIENRNGFRPRANFSGNIYKNTLYLFGGFVNLSGFKSTDELVTLTLTQTRHALRQEQQQRHSVIARQRLSGQNTYCSACSFEFFPQSRSPIPEPVLQVNRNFLSASTLNIIYGAKFIATPFEALGLVIDSLARLTPTAHKLLTVDLKIQSGQNGQREGRDQVLRKLLQKAYVLIDVKGAQLNKDQLEELAWDYRCQVGKVAFDLKNGLFRLGREVLFAQLFEDGILHAHLLTSDTLQRHSIHMQTLLYELQQPQNRLLNHFLEANAVDLTVAMPDHLTIFIGSLTRFPQGLLELKSDPRGQPCQQAFKQISEFLQDYFLYLPPITLQIQGKPIPISGYEKSLRSEGKQREQQPTTTRYFSKVHLILKEQCQASGQSNNSIKLYGNGRKVGTFGKYPFVHGFMELNDSSTLNYPRTRCDSYEVRKAVEDQIKALLDDKKKRASTVSAPQLYKEVNNHHI